MMYMMGDPGFFGAIKRLAGAGLRSLPGGQLVSAVRAALPGRPRPGLTVVPTPGFRGALERALPFGKTGLEVAGGRRFGGRRMNAGNAKAARRAIRRIKAVRHLLMSIERELPRRPAARSSSRGVITRSEASRALRR